VLSEYFCTEVQYANFKQTYSPYCYRVKTITTVLRVILAWNRLPPHIVAVALNFYRFFSESDSTVLLLVWLVLVFILF